MEKIVFHLNDRRHYFTLYFIQKKKKNHNNKNLNKNELQLPKNAFCSYGAAPH